MALAYTPERLRAMQEPLRAELAERKLWYFVREAWPIIEPIEPFIDSWHIGCVCFPHETKIETEDGLKAIGDIVDSKWSGKVLSWNHAKDRSEWRTVNGWMKSPGRPLVKITLNDGTSITPTGNHPVFVKGRGYARADQVVAGDTCLHVRPVQKYIPKTPISQRHVLLASVQIRSSKRTQSADQKEPCLSDVRQGILSKSGQATWRLLQHAVLGQEQNSSAKYLHRLQWRYGMGQCEPMPEMLFERQESKERPNCPLHELRQGCLPNQLRLECDKTSIWRVLQSPVFCGVFSRPEQSWVYPRQQSSRVSSGILASEAADSSARRSELFSVRQGKTEGWQGSISDQPGNTPHRPRQDEQQQLEFSDVVYDVPLSPKRNARGSGEIVESVVRSVERTVRIPDAVYNIEVEGNHNYFAGVLVHNCEHLEAMTSLEIRKLILNMPRRRGKSILASVCWFCWSWIRNPGERWSYISYGSKLSERDSKKCHAVITSPWYQKWWGNRFQIKNANNAAAEHFENDKAGYRMSTSTGGKTIGWGGSHNIADDLHNLQDAWSPTILTKQSEVWTQGVHQSVNNPMKTRFLVVMQRLAELDVAGTLMRDKLGYETLILPEEYEPCRVFFGREDASKSKERHPIIMTKLQRERPTVKFGPKEFQLRDPRTLEGELLCPERYPREAVEEEKKALKAYGTASQKQQRPSPLEGTIFTSKMFRYFRKEYRNDKNVFALGVKSGDQVKDRVVPIENCRFFQTIDTAQKDEKKHDYTVIGTWALTPSSDLLLYHLYRCKIQVPQQFAFISAARENQTRWDETHETIIQEAPWPRRLLFQAVEDAASGIGLIQQAQAAGIPFKALSADKKRLERIAPISTMYYSGQVYHLEGSIWIPDYEGELMGFPNAHHDDQVMVAAYAGYLTQHDVILRSGLGRPLVVSDEEATKEAERLAGIENDNRVKLNIGGVDVEFDLED